MTEDACINYKNIPEIMRRRKNVGVLVILRGLDSATLLFMAPSTFIVSPLSSYVVMIDSLCTPGQLPTSHNFALKF